MIKINSALSEMFCSKLAGFLFNFMRFSKKIGSNNRLTLPPFGGFAFYPTRMQNYGSVTDLCYIHTLNKASLLVKGLRGRPWREHPLPLRPKMFSISCSFFGNFGKSVCWRPQLPLPEGWCSLLRGILDPGSAPDFS